jgi:hypothetical protein
LAVQEDSSCVCAEGASTNNIKVETGWLLASVKAFYFMKR